MVSALIFAAITISTAFESGSLGRVEHVAATHIRCAVEGQSDAEGRNRQASWYYFRLTNLPTDADVRIDLTDLVGEYNYRKGSHAVTAGTRPVFSYDDRTWTHFRDDQVSWNQQEVELTLRFRPERRTMWIAHVAPYTLDHLSDLRKISNAWSKHERIGKSVKGRDLEVLTITDSSVAEEGKRVVWLMARQHAWEAGTSWVADGAVRFLLSNNTQAEQIRRNTIFRVMPIFDPDGVSEGAVRFNVNGYDNNRNWDVVDARRMPEIHATRSAIHRWLEDGRRIDVFLALHNTESTDYVTGPPALASLAERLVASLRELTDFHDPRSPRNTVGVPASARGRMTVNEALFVDRKIPAFLMELMVERHPVLKRSRTVADFVAFGKGLAISLARR